MPNIKFKIRAKITYTIAITLFFIILITTFIFTQLFITNNRNMHLYELSSQNKRFTEFIENNYDNIKVAINSLKISNSFKKLENIIGAKITIIDENQNILLNPLGLSNENLKKIIYSDKDVRRFLIFSTFTNRKNYFGKLVDFEITKKRYYTSIYEFKINDIKYYSIFLKKQSEIEIPPAKYFLTFLFVFMIAAVVSILTGVFLGRHFSNPILKLNKSVSNISNGNYDENINIKSSDEIGILAKNINTMKNKIKRSQDSLKEFTSMVSHEIKNMLTSIHGYTVGIKEGIYKTSDELKNALNIIITKTKDLENITNSLLMLSKIENKIIEIAKEKINIEKILENLIKLYKPELIKNKLNIEKIINLSNNIYLYTDKYLLQTILSNFINNAIKYSEKDSTIKINVYTRNKYMIFSVSNKGYTVPKDEKEKIFKMFYRSNKFDFKNIKGFGLGLAISKKIASFLNAKLKFKTTNNINTFSLEILYK